MKGFHAEDANIKQPLQELASHSLDGPAVAPSQGAASLPSGCLQEAAAARADTAAVKMEGPHHTAEQAQQPHQAALGTEQSVGSAQALSSHQQPYEAPSSRAESAEPDQEAGARQLESSAGPSRAQSDEMGEDVGSQGHALIAPRGRKPKYVTPVDELDNSDVESAQVRTSSSAVH